MKMGIIIALMGILALPGTVWAGETGEQSAEATRAMCQSVTDAVTPPNPLLQTGTQGGPKAGSASTGEKKNTPEPK